MVHLIISVPLPQILEQIAEVMKVIQQEQISKRIVTGLFPGKQRRHCLGRFFLFFTQKNLALHGMRLSCKKPAKCLKELHSPEQQHDNTHRLFIKLCWLWTSTLSAQTAL